MREGTASFTALQVARLRAMHQILDTPMILEDPLAMALLGSELTQELLRGETPEPMALRQTRAFVVARSRLSQDLLQESLRLGVQQYVVLGAGLDGSCYRENGLLAQTHMFEVDHPFTQSWKQRLLADAGITPPQNLTSVAVDFEIQDLATQLSLANFNQREPTFVSWLGVTPYLTKEAFLRTASYLATLPKLSAVIFDYAIPPSMMTNAELLGYAMTVEVSEACGEPFCRTFNSQELRLQLGDLGFSVVEEFGQLRLNKLYFSGNSEDLALQSNWVRIIHARV